MGKQNPKGKVTGCGIEFKKVLTLYLGSVLSEDNRQPGKASHRDLIAAIAAELHRSLAS